MSAEWKKYTVRMAKELDLVGYLRHIGFDYDKRSSRSKYYCYYSPFRLEERTPSFKIEKGTDHWVDFGKADGVNKGSIIDFGIAFHVVRWRNFWRFWGAIWACRRWSANGCLPALKSKKKVIC